MFRKLIIIIFLVFLSSGCGTFDLESARQAYESGDYKTVTELLIPLAEAGDAEAQTDLGFMYANGLGVPQDYTEALKWYRKAVAQGYALGQNNLGVMYKKGHGVPKDYTEAVKWYRKAAIQGNARAQNNLGGMYAEGLGVTQDYVQSYAWFQLAAEGGLEKASAARMDLRRAMNSNELEEARKLGRELWEKYGNKNNN